jgi:DNA-binding transcriptional LysR family regulator
VNNVDVELRDFRLAVTASQHRSLRQAAEALNIRQSTLSRRLRDIERRLGVVLFERTNGGTRLTTMGLEFILRVCLRIAQWTMRRHKRLPRATWIIALETSIRFS